MRIFFVVLYIAAQLPRVISDPVALPVVPRGVNPDETTVFAFDRQGNFQCHDGSKAITGTRFNDDYCDCLDGSDEPGTGACAGKPTQFYCPNPGHLALSVRSSRVDDGVCDCCDGSDEPSGLVSCPRTRCTELALELKLKQEAEAQLRNFGGRKRSELVSTSSQAFQKMQAERIEKKEKHNGLLMVLLDLLERKEKEEKIEEKEKLAQQYGYVRNYANDDSTELMRMEEFYRQHTLSRRVFGYLHDLFNRFILRKASGEHYVRVEAEAARIAYQDKKKEADQLNKEIEDIDNALAVDYGPERVFFATRLDCLQLKASGYTYKFCPFQGVYQINENGGESCLGKYAGWGPMPLEYVFTEDVVKPPTIPNPTSPVQYNQQHYVNGSFCWEIPVRTTQVIIECGAESMFRSVGEPSKCAYELVWTTPAACAPEEESSGKV
eukprot:TRINITY_DN55575_c0_g1_i1.p1 TRINITY_DN55575_c0_g1~~TRINITY_DN55575_c0_g1_i1.p1  ORF type:complete len:447 (-),score=80.69 TRINITY_DN55575_c0_g1_i1:784-2094(-)